MAWSDLGADNVGTGEDKSSPGAAVGDFVGEKAGADIDDEGDDGCACGCAWLVNEAWSLPSGMLGGDDDNDDGTCCDFSCRAEATTDMTVSVNPCAVPSVAFIVEPVADR